MHPPKLYTNCDCLLIVESHSRADAYTLLSCLLFVFVLSQAVLLPLAPVSAAATVISGFSTTMTGTKEGGEEKRSGIVSFA